MLRLTNQMEVGLLVDAYNTIRVTFAIVGLLQVILLISIITISVIKPWGRINISGDATRVKKQTEEGVA